jgi:hydroxymethylglutaryl-CoA reductase (NADPH)
MTAARQPGGVPRDAKPAPAAGQRPAVDEIVRDLAAGDLGFHQLPRELPAGEAAALRRRALEEITGTALEHIGRFTLDADRAAARHCENLIGAAQIPMGIVGPVRVRGEHVDDEILVPLATTEGALLASVNRGCAAIRRAGGAVVHVEDVGMTRAPVFRTGGIEETRHFLSWVAAHMDEIRRAAEATSRFLRLVEVEPRAVGTTVFLRFRCETGDAMGMNMVTIACDRVVRDLIEPATGVRCVALSGNVCVDKKASAINFQEGRGKRIYAEVELRGEPLERTLKSSARALVEANFRKNLMGSIVAGAMGWNAQFANVLAAFFVATGQDLAHVVEGAMGITGIEAKGDDGVLFSVYLPDVPLGAIGGGTGLGTQREALALLGVVPDEKRPGAAALRLAEIVGAVVLAGEVSLMAAFTSQDLARAHERLGRGLDETSGRDPAP